MPLQLPQEAIDQLAKFEAENKGQIGMANYKAIKAHTEGKAQYSSLNNWLGKYPHLHQYIHLLKAARS